MYRTTVNSNRVTINNGIVYVNGERVGSATKKLKYGYHPALKVTIGNAVKWFELDEENLKEKVAEYAEDHVPDVAQLGG